MKTITTSFLLSALVLSSNVLAQGQHSHVSDFSFDEHTISTLPLHSVQVVNEQAFLFSDNLQDFDLESFLLSYAPHLIEKKEVILHWAGYSSISPKLLLAMMESQSQILSTPSKKNLFMPFASLSSKVGFDNQIKDIALSLSKRYYAYQKYREETKSSIQPTSNASTVALISLFQKQNAGLNELLEQYERLFANDSLKLSPDTQVKPLSIEPQANFTMQLPWPSGYAWYSGGAHSNTGSGYPYSSLDFNNGSGGWGSNTPWVQASHGGTVTRYSSCSIRVTHPSGYATQYYHMDSLQYQSGDVISSGAWLGRYANNKNQALCQGGSSSGPHVHFSLLNNGRFISLHNWYITGYRIDVGNWNYDDNCWNFYFEKNGNVTCAWQRLYK
ncbi:M23 family metallopeptidase [Pseudoalteromonas sp. S16_S37]|uniref:M23 family metallopeptidase n=1 Tax=Pseudoalteromonas sp. S16_S37 TaxID=2720228 RepID=UPI0016812422|nr:peptidoglycan DD-metalloendopeptidase family protein [Pseudoalteromonas sp. S16_S37]MBD1582030.1 M23 family metallopeptidase [Pseudoalteromonas sp. S16_S37]